MNTRSPDLSASSPPVVTGNADLLPLNTFGVPAKARYMATVYDTSGLVELIRNEQYQNLEKLVLGGGSNLLFVDDFPGLILHIGIGGIEVTGQDEQHVWVRAGAGIVWHDLVEYCIRHGYAGIENLSLIPGQVGAAPIQNIGAYGSELKEVFEELQAVDLYSGTIHTFNREQCRFGYRDSVFKNAYRDRFAITQVTLRLNREPEFRTGYGTLRQTLKQMNVEQLTIRAISDAIIQIRRSKLPDPSQTGNAGSFFKNPAVSAEFFEELRQRYPDLPGYTLSAEQVKIPAGWLIDRCGWKGQGTGNAATHKRQALVIVNRGGATGREILDLACRIRRDVEDTFAIRLTPEVRIIGAPAGQLD